MPEWIDAFFAADVVQRYRRLLLWVAGIAGLLQLVTLVLSLLLPDNKSVVNLVAFSKDVLNVTLWLVIVALIASAMPSLSGADAKRRDDLHRFLRETLKDWGLERDLVFEPATLLDTQHQGGSGSRRRFTHLKIHGAFDADAGGDTYRRDVHFELTLYPCHVIYGLHFELKDGKANRWLCERARDVLELSPASETGFAVDRKTPKQPGWCHLVRDVELTGDPGKDSPTILTHARHFAELVLHAHEALYGPIERAYRAEFLGARSAAE